MDTLSASHRVIVGKPLPLTTGDAQGHAWNMVDKALETSIPQAVIQAGIKPSPHKGFSN